MKVLDLVLLSKLVVKYDLEVPVFCKILVTSLQASVACKATRLGKIKGRPDKTLVVVLSSKNPVLGHSIDMILKFDGKYARLWKLGASLVLFDLGQVQNFSSLQAYKSLAKEILQEVLQTNLVIFFMTFS